MERKHDQNGDLRSVSGGRDEDLKLIPIGPKRPKTIVKHNTMHRFTS